MNKKTVGVAWKIIAAGFLVSSAWAVASLNLSDEATDLCQIIILPGYLVSIMVYGPHGGTDRGVAIVSMISALIFYTIIFVVFSILWRKSVRIINIIRSKLPPRL